MAAKIKVQSLHTLLFRQVLGNAEPFRIYLYSTRPQIERAVEIHESNCYDIFEL